MGVSDYICWSAKVHRYIEANVIYESKQDDAKCNGASQHRIYMRAINLNTLMSLDYRTRGVRFMRTHERAVASHC